MPGYRKFSIRDTLQGIRLGFEQNRRLLIRTTLLLAFLNAVTGLLDLTGPAGFAVQIGFLVLFGALYGGLVTAMVCLPGRPEGIGELWQAVKPVLARLIWLTLVVAGTMAILLAPSAFVEALGILLIPAIMIAVAWSVAGQAVVVERLGVFPALGRSAKLVKGHGWAVFGYLLVVSAISIVLIVLALLVSLPFGTVVGYGFVFPFLSNLVWAPLYALGAAALYNELAGRGVNPEAGPPAPPADED